jgi:hypothetical protein
MEITITGCIEVGNTDRFFLETAMTIGGVRFFFFTSAHDSVPTHNHHSAYLPVVCEAIA